MYAENLISTPEAQADFYPTPKELGKKMVQGIDLGFISTVLEPSAGKGDLIRCLAEKVIAQEYRCNPHTLNVDAIEIDPYIRSILKYEFGGARQQEIQHILREFEDRTRYDYKLNKEVGLNDEEKAARAQLKHESSLRDKISLHIVHDDFLTFATVYKGNIIKNLIMDCQSYTKYRPNETTGGIFVSWRRKEELPTGA